MSEVQEIVKEYAKESWQTKMGVVEYAFKKGFITNAEHTTLTSWYMAEKSKAQALEEAILFGEVLA